MTKQELGKQIYDCSYMTGEFTLRSGQKSTEYFDKYQFESRPSLLAEICVQIGDTFLDPDQAGSVGIDNIDIFAGLETGGIPIATLLSLMCHGGAFLVPTVFVRKARKDYGTCRIAEGVSVKDQRVVVIEDVVTTGGQIIKSVADLREEGAVVANVICVIDREAGGAQALLEHGMRLHSLFTMSELKEFGK